MRTDREDAQSSSHPVLSYADGLAVSAHDAVLLIGRVLLGAIFVTSGWRKIFDIPGFAITMGGRGGLPEWLGYIAVPVELLGGLAIVLGLGTRYAALLILLFVIIATFSSHAYWTYPAAQQAAQFGQFSKNMSIMGGLVLLFLLAGGRFSLDGLLSRKT